MATTAQRLTYLAATHTHTRQLDAAALAAYLSELHDAGRAASSAALRWADVAVGDRASQRVFSEAVQTADMRVDNAQSASRSVRPPVSDGRSTCGAWRYTLQTNDED